MRECLFGSLEFFQISLKREREGQGERVSFGEGESGERGREVVEWVSIISINM